MKKTAKTLLMLIMLLVATLAFSSCSDDGKFDKNDKMTLVVAEEEAKVFEIPLADFKKSDSLVSVLDYLKEEGKLDYEISGTFLTRVGDVKNEGNRYLYVFTTVEADVDVSQYASTVQYGDMTITSSGVGANEMHLENGATIYIGTIVWE